MSQKRTIVVVDDEPNQAKMLEEFLTTNGYIVVVAMNGHQALQTVMDVRPDMVLLDLMLPDMSGAHVCAQLRASSATQRIPIILCTAHKVTAIEKIQGFQAGADDYLIRPFDLSELLARMQAIFRRSVFQPKAETLASINAIVNKAPAELTAPSPTEKKHLPPLPRMPAPLASTLSAPTATSSIPTAPNILCRVRDVLNHPWRTFSAVGETEDFLVAITLVLVTPVINSFSKLFGQAGNFDNWIGFFSLGVVVHLIMWFGVGGLLHMTLPFQGINVPMKKALTLAGLTWAPRCVEAALGLVYVCVGTLLMSGETVRFSSGLDILPGLPPTGFVSFLSHIGIFDVWSVALTLIGTWALNPTNKRRWNSITVIILVSCFLIGILSNF